VFDKARLLELVRSFIVFEEAREGVVKKLAGYHQVGAVREALARPCAPPAPAVTARSAWSGTPRAAASR
jgi:hypothetical protein